MYLIIMLCVNTVANCDKDSSYRIIRIPVSELQMNCERIGQDYAVQNGLDLQDTVMVSKCRLGGSIEK